MSLLFYANESSPRLTYIVSTLLDGMGIHQFEICYDLQQYEQANGPRINYSPEPISPGELWIAPSGLLYKKGIKKQSIECFDFFGLKAFFKSGGEVPFDIFSASFYLLTRYEEYLPHQLDEYGRYAHTNSIAFNEGFLQQPLINLWMKQLAQLLSSKFPTLKIQAPTFQFIPTYDIDIAWSYLNKGVIRNLGGLARELAEGDWNDINERLQVLMGKKKDPFDVYEWLDELHQSNNLSAIYFVLLGKKNIGYDKNISPSKVAFRRLIKQLATKNKIGIHPSWQSGDDRLLLKDEVQLLQEITGMHVKYSRQHYIRLTMPTTYQLLIDEGIEADFSMGYGSINGFRCSYCLPFRWYDISTEQTTNLTVYPFCFMEANSFFEQRYTLEQATQELQHYYHATKDVNGMLVTIFHNHTLGDQHLFNGWKEMYANFCKQLI